MKTLEFRNEVTQNCAKNKACGTKLKFDSSSFEKHFLSIFPFSLHFLFIFSFSFHFFTTCAALWRVVPNKLTKQTVHLCTLRGAPVVYARLCISLVFICPAMNWMIGSLASDRAVQMQLTINAPDHEEPGKSQRKNC